MAVDAPPPSISTSARVERDQIVATWSFGAAVAPATFAVTVTEQLDDRERPVTTSVPIRTERRDGSAVVEWVATITLTESPDDRAFRVRATAGSPINVGERLRSPTRTPTLPPDAVDELVDLRNLLDQQPDRGHEILSRLLPSADPEEMRANIDAEIDRALDPDTRAIWPFASAFKPDVDETALAKFVDAYKLSAIAKDAAGNQSFQTKEDWARYASARGAPWFHLGGEVDRPLSEELASPAIDMTHDVRASEIVDGSIEVALFADNANGLHASRAIAKQIVHSGLPYAFHLGDVYYGGKEAEFANYFSDPLSPMLDQTELFMITGNHEMFARGEWFKRMIRQKASDHPQRQRQRAESFRLRGDGFQIIGLDTMFVGWKSGRVRIHDYVDEDRLRLLDTWLSEHPRDLAVLMTTNHAWDLGSSKTTRLYESIREIIAGRVDLWFWGNVHYASLFEAWPFADSGSPTRQMITSCIGHGGYPFYTQDKVGKLPPHLKCRWLETKSRFWPDARVRPDVGLNGWCRMKLTRGADRLNVCLTYLDWVGRERLRANLVRPDGGSIQLDRVEESQLAAVGADPTWHLLGFGAAP